jgi:hypothetical protein
MRDAEQVWLGHCRSSLELDGLTLVLQITLSVFRVFIILSSQRSSKPI